MSKSSLVSRFLPSGFLPCTIVLLVLVSAQAAALVGPPVDISPEPAAECPYCIEKQDLVQASTAVFSGTVHTLNEQGLILGPHGGDVWREAALGLFDDDGDFVPDFVEDWILRTDIFTVEDDMDPTTPDPVRFETEWRLLVSHHQGVFYGGAALLELVIGPHGSLEVTVCPLEDPVGVNDHTQTGPCVLQSRAISEVEFGILPAGFWFEVVGPTDARELLVVVDLDNADAPGVPYAFVATAFAATSPTNGSPLEAGAWLAIATGANGTPVVTYGTSG